MKMMLFFSMSLEENLAVAEYATISFSYIGECSCLLLDLMEFRVSRKYFFIIASNAYDAINCQAATFSRRQS